MLYYLKNKIKVLSGGRQLPMVLDDLSFITEPEDSYTVFKITFPGYGIIKDPIILCNVLEETDPYHRNISGIEIGDIEYTFIFTNSNYFNSAQIPPYVETRARNIQSTTSTVKNATDSVIHLIK